MNIVIFDLPFPYNEDFFEPYDAELLKILKEKLLLKGYSAFSFSAHNLKISLSETINRIELFQADLIMIYTFFYRQQFLAQHYEYLNILITSLKKENPKLKTIGFGNPVEIMSDTLQIEKMGFDYVCRGNILESLSFLLENMESGKSSPVIVNINSFKNNKYELPQIFWDENNCLRISASKGCNCNCSFCIDKILYGEWQAYNCDEVVSSIKKSTENRKPRLIKFNDLNFIGQSQIDVAEAYVQKFCNIYLANLNSDIPIKIAARIDNISDNILSMLRSIGVSIIFYGVESGCQRILDFFSKGITPEKSVEVLCKTKAKGITPQIGFIFFDPFIVKDEIIENIDFLERISECTFLSLQIIQSLRVFAGTSYAKRFSNHPNFKNNGFTFSYDFIDDYSRLYYEKWILLFGRLKNVDMYIRYQLDTLLMDIEKCRNLQCKEAYYKIMRTYNSIIIRILKQLLGLESLENIICKYYDETNEVLLMIKALSALVY